MTRERARLRIFSPSLPLTPARMIPVVYHPAYLAYDFGPQHPFSPLRLKALAELLDALGTAPQTVQPAPATREDILSAHAEELVRQVEAASSGEPLPDAHAFGLATPDVPVFAGMDEATRSLTGGTLHAADLVAAGPAGRVLQFGPGLHHAQRALASGFCVYNDLAIAIHHLVARGLRVAYIDVDVHHGDGVQWLHYDAHDVMTISLHESGAYLFPGTGNVFELGEGAGKGLKLNVPLEPGTADESYLDAFERVVPHALSWFRPDVLLIMCGADAHFLDPLADLRLSTYAFERLFRRLIEVSDEFAHGRAVFTFGGGYSFDATVRVWAILYHLLQDLPLPERLPDEWLKRWEERTKQRLTPTLHDAPDSVHSTRAAAASQNEQTARRLLELAAPLWF